MKDKTPIAVASRTFSKHPILRNELLKIYKNVSFNDGDLVLKGKLLINFLKGKTKAIIALEKIDESVLKELPQLKVISKFGVGLDSLNLIDLVKYNISLGYTPGVNKRAVSELVLAFIIVFFRNIFNNNNDLKNLKWQQHKGRSLTNKIVGIIGCGNIGKDLITLLAPFQCKILYFDLLSFPDYEKKFKIKKSSLKNLLKLSDIVTIHLPLTYHTKNILNKSNLSLMKRNAILINTARGGLIEENVLKELLIKNQIGGAAFDVFKEEPPIDAELLNISNFICTSHIAGSTEESVIAMGRSAIKGLKIHQNSSKFLNLYTI